MLRNEILKVENVSKKNIFCTESYSSSVVQVGDTDLFSMYSVPGTVLSALYVLSPNIYLQSVSEYYYYYPHFIDEKTEAHSN